MKVSIELPAETRHCPDMTEKLLKATFKLEYTHTKPVKGILQFKIS